MFFSKTVRATVLLSPLQRGARMWRMYLLLYDQPLLLIFFTGLE